MNDEHTTELAKLRDSVHRKIKQKAKESEARLENLVKNKANWILFAIIGVVVVGVILSATGVIGG